MWIVAQVGRKRRVKGVEKPACRLAGRKGDVGWKWVIQAETEANPIGAMSEKNGVEKKGAGFVESRPRKVKLGHESKNWAKTVDSGRGLGESGKKMA